MEIAAASLLQGVGKGKAQLEPIGIIGRKVNPGGLNTLSDIVHGASALRGH